MNYGVTIGWKGKVATVIADPNTPLPDQKKSFRKRLRGAASEFDRIQVISSGVGIICDKRFHAQRHKGVKARNAVNPEGDAGCPPDPAGELDAPEAKVETSGETAAETGQQESAKTETEESAKVEISGEENAVETPSVETSSKATAETTATQPPAEPAKAATGRKRGSSQS